VTVGTLCLVGTHFESFINGSVCAVEDSVGPGASSMYTAICYDGQAYVELYIYDEIFSNSSSDNVPAECNPIRSGENTIKYEFMVPCSLSYDCPTPPDLMCEDVSPYISEEDFESVGELDNWTFAAGGVASENHFILMDESHPETFRMFDVPIDASAVKFEIDMFEQSGWGSTDLFYLRVANSYIDIAPFDIDANASSTGYYYNDILADVEAVGPSRNKISLVIPATWYSSGRLMLGMRLISSTARIGIDNVKLSPDCTTPATLPPTESCPTEAVLIDSERFVDFATPPITILSQGNGSVTFEVRQTITNGTLCLVGTYYESPTNNRSVCPVEDSVAPGVVGTHTAICHAGEAHVELYIYDAMFSNSGNAYVPEECNPIEPGESTIKLVFSLPCATWNWCPSVDNLNLKCTDVQPYISESNFESAAVLENWIFATDSESPTGNHFLLLDGSNTETFRTFDIPTDGSSVEVEFEVYEQNGWSVHDMFYLRINDNYLDLGPFDSAAVEASSTEYFNDVYVATQGISASRNKIFLTIPSTWFGDYGRLTLGMRIILSTPSASVGIDNFKLSATCGADSGRLLEHDQEQASPDSQTSENDITTPHKMMIVDPLGMPPPPVSEPGDEDGDDDGSYYCANVDFPCEDGKVYVCHYGGPEQGYVTFCIPEPDSEILRFYQRDYCGPCRRSGLPKASS
jgi:hypothetical protein